MANYQIPPLIKEAIDKLPVPPTTGDLLLAYFPETDENGELMLLNNKEIRQYISFIEERPSLSPINLPQMVIQILMKENRDLLNIVLDMASSGNLPYLCFTSGPGCYYFGLSDFTDQIKGVKTKPKHRPKTRIKAKPKFN